MIQFFSHRYKWKLIANAKLYSLITESANKFCLILCCICFLKMHLISEVYESDFEYSLYQKNIIAILGKGNKQSE